MGKVNSPGGSCCADDCLIEEYSFAQNDTTTIAGWETITGVARILSNALVLDPNTRIYAKDYTVQWDTVYITFEMQGSFDSIAGLEIPTPNRNPNPNSPFGVGYKVEINIKGADSQIRLIDVNLAVGIAYEGVLPCYPSDNFDIPADEWFLVEVCIAIANGPGVILNVYITTVSGGRRRFSSTQLFGVNGLQNNSQIGFFSLVGDVKFKNYQRWKSIYEFVPGNNNLAMRYLQCKPCDDCWIPGFNYTTGYPLTTPHFEEIFETITGSYSISQNPYSANMILYSSGGLFIHKEGTSRDSGVLTGIWFDSYTNASALPFKVRIVFSYREEDGEYWYLEVNPYELVSASATQEIWKLRLAIGNTIDGVLYEDSNFMYWYEPIDHSNPTFARPGAFYVQVFECKVWAFFNPFIWTSPFWCFNDLELFETGRWGFEILEANGIVGIYSFTSQCSFNNPPCVNVDPEQPPTEEPEPPEGEEPEPDDPIGCCDSLSNMSEGYAIEGQIFDFNFDPECTADECILLNDWFYGKFLVRNSGILTYKSATQMQFEIDLGTTNPCANCEGEPNLKIHITIKKNIERNVCEVTGKIFSSTCEGCAFLYYNEFDIGNDCSGGLSLFYDGPQNYICCLDPRLSSIAIYFL